MESDPDDCIFETDDNGVEGRMVSFYVIINT